MEEKNIIIFPQGVPGFEKYREWSFVIEEEAPLAQLVSVENEYIGFVLTRPEIYFADYLTEIEAEIDLDTQKVLEIKENTELNVWNILCIAEDIMETTINLKAPLLINLEKQIGCQLIFNQEK
jgi:flagellar assembly factor FliW